VCKFKLIYKNSNQIFWFILLRFGLLHFIFNYTYSLKGYKKNLEILVNFYYKVLTILTKLSLV